MLPIPSITTADALYPTALRSIFDPPEQLYYRGSLDFLKKPLIAVIGSRKMTSYGRHVIRTIVPELVRAGACIVSGLALGCDGEAHAAALDASGATIAILGGGIDDRTLHPQTNLQLAKRIIDSGGTVMSEYPPGSASYPSNFPTRNRIIAGMSAALIVIEAEIKSGSLITARLAADFGRNVFAIPGPINAPYSTGTNFLIQSGAHLATSAAEILETMGFTVPEKTAVQQQFSPDETTLMEALSEPRSLDELAGIVHKSASDLSATLTFLELKSAVRRAGNTYIRT